MSKNTIGNVWRVICANVTTRDYIKTAIDKEFQKQFGKPFNWTDEEEAETKQSLEMRSLTDFINKCPVLGRIDNGISAKTGLEVLHTDRFVEIYLDRMQFLGLKNISEIEPMIKPREQFIIAFGIHYDSNRKFRLGFVPRGCGIGILQVMLFLEKVGVEGFEKFLEKHRFDKKENPHELAYFYKTLYEKAVKETSA